jgi:hypothetical protein
VSNAAIQLLKLCAYTMLALHWTACIWAFLPVLEQSIAGGNGDDRCARRRRGCDGGAARCSGGAVAAVLRHTRASKPPSRAAATSKRVRASHSRHAR